jgi:hypothetical protein
MKGPVLKLVLPLITAIATGCTTAGTGSGATVGDHVIFSWNSTGPTSGTMSATLPDGSAYSGPFFEITDDVDNIGPIWNHWYSGWPALRLGDDAPSAGAGVHYSDRVVADLGTPDGEQMHCSFALVQPRQGMAGGGSGQCRMPDGSTIDATFPTT